MGATLLTASRRPANSKAIADAALPKLPAINPCLNAAFHLDIHSSRICFSLKTTMQQSKNGVVVFCR
jgi:hypothetical protein